MSNWPIFTSGLLAGITFLIHLFAGGKDVARPLLDSDIATEVKLTLYACWHLVSVALLLSSTALLASGSGLILATGMVAFISVLWLLFGAVFLVITLVVARPGGLFRFPQWILLVSGGGLGLWGLT